MAAKITLYRQLQELAHALSQSVRRQKVTTDSLENGIYSSDKTDIDDYTLQQAVAIMDLSIFRGLSAKATKYLLNLIEGMKRNNLFFKPENTTPHERGAIAELKRNTILLSTEKPGLYIINPFKLRRGKPLATIMASMHHYMMDNEVLQIEDIYPPKQNNLTGEMRLITNAKHIEDIETLD